MIAVRCIAFSGIKSKKKKEKKRDVWQKPKHQMRLANEGVRIPTCIFQHGIAQLQFHAMPLRQFLSKPEKIFTSVLETKFATKANLSFYVVVFCLP